MLQVVSKQGIIITKDMFPATCKNGKEYKNVITNVEVVGFTSSVGFFIIFTIETYLFCCCLTYRNAK